MFKGIKIFIEISSILEKFFFFYLFSLILEKLSHYFRDVRSPESCKKIIEEVVNHFGRLDILVNGAAGNFLCPAEDLSPNAFKTGINEYSSLIIFF